MKATIENKENEFQPITLKLTIETRRELEAFYLLVQAAKEDMANLVSKSKKASNLNGERDFVWEDLLFTKEIATSIKPIVYPNL